MWSPPSSSRWPWLLLAGAVTAIAVITNDASAMAPPFQVAAVASAMAAGAVLYSQRTEVASGRVLAETLDRVHAMCDSGAARPSLELLLDELLTSLRSLTGSHVAVAWMANERGDSFIARAAVGLEEEVQRRARLRVETAAGAGLLRADRVVDVHHAALRALSPAFGTKGVRRLASTAVVIDGRVIGLVQVGWADQRPCSRHRARLVKAVLDRAALILEWARTAEPPTEGAGSVLPSARGLELPLYVEDPRSAAARAGDRPPDAKVPRQEARLRR